MSARAWTAFAAVSTLWGIPYLFIKVAVDDGVPPVFLAWVRVTIAAAVLLVLAHRAGVLAAAWPRWRWLMAYAVIEIVVPFPLIAAGEQHVASSLAAILIAAVPMIVALLALRFDRAERATGRRAVGLGIGFAGVVALVGLDVSGSTTELLGALAILLAAVGYAAGPMLLNRTLTDLDPRALMAVSLLIASAVLTVPALAAPPRHAPSGRGRALPPGARAVLHGGGLRPVRRAHRRGRPRPRHGHHLRRAGRRGDARRERPGRAAGRRGGRRAAADPRRLVAVDRRPRPAGAATALRRMHGRWRPPRSGPGPVGRPVDARAR